MRRFFSVGGTILGYTYPHGRHKTDTCACWERSADALKLERILNEAWRVGAECARNGR